MEYETFRVDRSGQIATVVFNRPEKLNPINEQVMQEFLDIARTFQADEETGRSSPTPPDPLIPPGNLIDRPPRFPYIGFATDPE